jgi:16S rRNA G966 N2-methylase RsmD
MLGAYAPKNGFVFDPFLGSGTVAFEAATMGYDCAGTEINPAAATLARTYELMNLPKDERKSILDSVEYKFFEIACPQNLPLFGSTSPLPSIQETIKSLAKVIESRYEKIIVEALCILIEEDKAGTESKRRSIWKNLRSVIQSWTHTNSSIVTLLSDSRKTPLPSNSVDLVITSPPYINVFNYHQQYRKTCEMIGWQPLSVAKSEIGANRKHRSNRFLTVIQYCMDIAQCIHELDRLAKPGARAIFVVGRESSVLKTPFFNGNLIKQIIDYGNRGRFRLEQERVFMNRFGQSIFEDILHFDLVSGDSTNLVQRGRMIGVEALRSSLGVAPESSKADIAAAISSADEVQPSPIVSFAGQPPFLLSGFRNHSDNPDGETHGKADTSS